MLLQSGKVSCKGSKLVIQLMVNYGYIIGGWGPGGLDS